MPTITFDQIHARLAEHQAAEAARNAPAAVARRAVYALTSALGDLNDADYYAVVELLHAEIAALNVAAD